MNLFLRAVKAWLPMAFFATMVCALVYVAVQQSYRISANDPQIQMAEDAALAIKGGAQLQSLNLSGTVNIGQSLSPYIVFYNEAGTATGGNGLLDGRFPLLPQGVFDYARAAHEDRLTWQPQPGVRNAIVVVKIDGDNQGFVMAGRSLREVEIREWQLEMMVGLAWIITLLGTLVLQMAVMRGKHS
jgi:hypothetical protein